MMRSRKYKVFLTPTQRERLRLIVTSGRSPARKIMRANILLLLDESRFPVKNQAEIAEICNTSVVTVYKVSKQFAENGLEPTIKRKERLTPPVPSKITSYVESQILAINASNPPRGCSRWTLKKIAHRAVELNIIDSISGNTVGRILRRNQKRS